MDIGHTPLADARTQTAVGDINQLNFVIKHADMFKGPFLEVGSKDYGSTQNTRSIFESKGEYIGLDMEPGDGVDSVVDLTCSFDKVDSALGGRRFGTVFCLSVLEHCADPFGMARNITGLLEQGGRLCISAPFCWRLHPYPKDYWRFTPEGIKCLFPEIDFDMDISCAATSRPGEFQKLDREAGRVRLSFSKHWNNGHRLRAVSAFLLRSMGRIGLLRWLAGHRCLFAPTNIIMVGRLTNRSQG